MSKRTVVSILKSVVILVGVFLLVLAVPFASATSVFASRSTSAPEHPNVLYLAPQGSVRGLVNDSVMQARGATVVRSWAMAQSNSVTRKLDAVVIDATQLDTMNPWDEVWLRTQYHGGVVLVGLGVDDDSFAHRLGLDTFRAPAEANVPLGPTGYRLTSSLALGTPEDLQIFHLSDWVNQIIRGEFGDRAQPRVKNYATRSYGSSRGTLDSARDVDVLFIQLGLAIDGMYKMRSDFAEQLKKPNRNAP